MFWLAEDDCAVAQSAASRDAEGRLDLYVRVRCLPSGAHAEPDAQRSSDVVRPGRSVSARAAMLLWGRSVARKITPQMLENSRMTQTDQEIAGSERFFRSLLVSRTTGCRCPRARLGWEPAASTQSPD